MASAVFRNGSAESNPAGSLLVASEPATTGAAAGRDAAELSNPRAGLLEPPAGRLLSELAVLAANGIFPELIEPGTADGALVCSMDTAGANGGGAEPPSRVGSVGLPPASSANTERRPSTEGSTAAIGALI